MDTQNSTLIAPQLEPRMSRSWKQALVFRLFSRMEHGRLKMCLPCRREVIFGEPGTEPQAELRIRDEAFFGKVLFGGSIGFGESFMEGHWDSPDLVALLALLGQNRDALSGGHTLFAVVSRLLDRMQHVRQNNSLLQSRKNIQAHYDLSNEFYKTFLDPSMTYSSGMYREEGDSLEQSQRNKIQALIEKADIASHHHLLEIGSGWGSFALEAARQTGCRVTSLTLSEAQLAWATRAAEGSGLADRVSFQLCDYRKVQGTFDRIVSIEMLEAVGHEYFDAYFSTVDRLLRDGGRAVLQVITIPDPWYDRYRRGTDFIRKHIFPGGHLPSLAALRKSIQRASRLAVESVEDIGPHYARTLRDWRHNFVEQSGRIHELGFDETFQRKWVYYFAYCEAGFATRTLHDLHLALVKK